MKTLGYYNGKFGELQEMTVPMNDRVCYFGDGVYEATLARNYRIYCLDEHIDRLFSSMAQLSIPAPMSKEEMKEELYRMVRKMDEGDLLVYWQVTRGTGLRNHAFPEEPCSNLWIALWEGHAADLSEPICLTHTEDTRFLHCNIKTLNLIPSVMASQKAKELGVSECVFHRGDIVTECAHSNIHILKNGVFITHPADCYILPGIARKNLLDYCRQNGIPTEERPFTMEELYDADEVIVSSSGSFALRALKMDERDIGGKDEQLMKRLQNAMNAHYYEQTEGR
ncbi:MAG: aminotransferase class IV [Clostridia bacterium]|nr:aminotransferase class IV [Clostridia bacterium]